MEEVKDGYTIKDTRGTEKDDSSPKVDEKDAIGEKSGNQSPQDTSFSSYNPPKLDFSTLVMSFATTAMMSLGKIPDPQTGKTMKDLALAKQNIDIISILEEKTKGNLSQEEQSLVKNVLYELRLAFVEASK